ncbi:MULTISPECIES: glycerol-3-phosphate 1-O-acyltransferase PlsY [Bacillaceae]|uniref:glycerol-3-phosphate 1-O-acyltransferase PlsY n=1 Tax=Bacillaceae TaxID=186817 RepID=UPI0006AE4796|nr:MULTISPECIES: glycerol-3-phosphate 1-O-acyltransferase PlsY [Bacillaceae]ALC85516.1 glycerol-3-phosphate acyltransferase [Bacillus sp. FJAT-22090]KQL35946.1 glycerol-3-phosphate acyltransferase [Psychrobacillus sp. FJAT-21963]MDF2066889.1 glycerol-3-phosphate 1-O-acyltransferase PlsY [Bacillus sp. Cr_A10]
MTTFILLLLAYLIGSIPSGLWVGKLFYNTDIREHGSGNLGGTNTFRTLGKKAGLVVTIMDILKGTAATLLGALPFFESANVHPLILGIIAVVGHMFPIFAKFKGGKAVATSGGILLGYNWPIFVLLVVGFFIILKLTKMVSLTSMILSIIAVLYAIIYHYTVDHDLPLIGIVLLLAIFIFYRHRTNIKRIKEGTEPKVKWI